MKRLLCILSSMNAGGAETFLMKVYRNIDKTKYQFDFCVNSKERGFYDKEIEDLGGFIYHIPSKSENLKLFKKELKNIIVRNEYEYVLRITANAAGLMDLKIAKKSGAKKCIARSSNSNCEKGIKNKISHILGKVLYLKYVDVAIAPSKLAADYTFGNFGSNRVSIIHNALNVYDYKYSKLDRDRIRKEFNLQDNAIVFGNIGRFMIQKNHVFLINVFEKIHEQNKDTYLMLVGNGELESKIQNLVISKGLEKYVLFIGIRSDIPKILSSLDLLIMPSLYEGMPNTVIEAQANGLPCVISDTITKEANITGLVKYVSLSESYRSWADIALESISKNRLNTYEHFFRNNYDINSVTEQFIDIIFGD